MKKLKTYLTLSLLLISSLIVSGQEDSDHDTESSLKEYNKAIIWRGFEHRWTYNHRLNRLGNYVAKDSIPYLVHTSASGLGSDSTFAKSYYSYVQSPDLVFKEIQVKLFLSGKEGDLLTKTQESHFDLKTWEQGMNNYSVLLNGFEIKSLRKADQLQMLRFYVEDPIYSKQTEQIQVTSHFNLVTNCRTIECPILNNKTMYELTLYLLIIGYENGNGNYYNGYSTRNYEWDTKLEVSESTQNVKINGEPIRYEKAFLGIRGIGVILDSEHWILEMKNYVSPMNYDPKKGEMLTLANIKFVEWTKGMSEFSTAPMKSKFAKRRRGFAMLDMNMALIQTKNNALIEHGSEEIHMYWKGWNKPANNESSFSKINLTPKQY
jgi:hypothetical protein